ncbi:hypothetical protein [Nocardia xishanensis]
MIMSDVKNPNVELVRVVFDRMAGGDRVLGAAMAEDFAWTFSGGPGRARGLRNPLPCPKLLGPLMAQFASDRLGRKVFWATVIGSLCRRAATGVAAWGETYEETYCMVFRVAEGQLA